MPAVFVLVGCFLMRSGINSIFDKKLPDLTLSLSSYNPGITVDPNPIYYNRDGGPLGYAVWQRPPPENPTWNANYLYNGSVNGQGRLMSLIPDAIDLPIVPYDVSFAAPYLQNVSWELLQSRNSHKASRYGAYSFGYVTPEEYRYTIHVNYTGVHAAPIYQNVLNDAILKSVDPAQSIKTVIKPLAVTKNEVATAGSFNGFPVVIMIMLAFAFIPAAFALFVVRERETKAKHLQVSFMKQ